MFVEQLEWTRSENSSKLCIGQKRAKPLFGNRHTCALHSLYYTPKMHVCVCSMKLTSWNGEGKLSFIFKSDLAVQPTYVYIHVHFHRIYMYMLIIFIEKYELI